MYFIVIIYVASKTKHLEFWRALRAAGLPIVASWIDSEINLSDLEPSSDALLFPARISEEDRRPRDAVPGLGGCHCNERRAPVALGLLAPRAL
jgi:hypothetical protein